LGKWAITISILVISFSLVFSTVPVFADTITVTIPSGSAVPGCEDFDDCLIPSNVVVKKGDTVKWINRDNIAHTVTSGNAADGPSGIFDSSLVMASFDFSVRFTELGTFEYFCMLHPWQTGTVTVKSTTGFNQTPEAPTTSKLPDWVKNIFVWYGQGQVSEAELLESIKWMIENNVIQVSSTGTDSYKYAYDNLKKENQQLKAEIGGLQAILNSILEETDSNSYLDDSDYLDSGCPVGYPFLWSDGDCYTVSEPNCPADHPYSWSDGFCYKSPEYLDNGCHSDFPYLYSNGYCYTIPESTYDEQVDSAPSCDPSYPDVCIPSYPPDLDCDEIFYSNFRVVGNDPHGFDTDYDGIGCEVGSPSSPSPPPPTQPSCDPSYPDVCITPYPPDLDCGEIGYSNFRVVGNDPHGFDRDNDGIGCES